MSLLDDSEIRKEVEEKQKLLTKKPWPEQREDYRPSFEFDGVEFPSTGIINFNPYLEHMKTTGAGLITIVYNRLFQKDYHDDENREIASVYYVEPEWALYDLFDTPLLVMDSMRRVDRKGMYKSRKPVLACVVRYVNPLSPDDVWRDTVFNNRIREGVIYSHPETKDRVQQIIKDIVKELEDAFKQTS